MPNSGDSASRKCLSGVLSRMLCSGSLPTHPSEQLTESSSDKFGDEKPGNNTKQVVGTTTTAVAAASPGVVARLMGLESFPTTPRDTSLGAYFRSKSVNSIDFLSYFDPIKQHRRVRTSVSFHYQGDDFTSIILRETEENRDDKEELFIRKWPDEQSRGYFQEEERRKNRECFQVSSRPGKNREFFQDSGPGNLASRKKDFQGKTSVRLKERRPTVKAEEIVGSKRVKRRRKKKIHPQGFIPEVGRSSRNELKSQCRNSYSRRSREDAIIKVKNERKVKIKESCYYTSMVEEICMLSEEDLKENWIHGKELKFQDYEEEIIQQFGHEILQVLLNQFVDELVLLLG